MRSPQSYCGCSPGGLLTPVLFGCCWGGCCMVPWGCVFGDGTFGDAGAFGAGAGCVCAEGALCWFTPMAAPETTICTRRFCARPAAVELSATGLAGPYPVAVTFAGATPCDVR